MTICDVTVGDVLAQIAAGSGEPEDVKSYLSQWDTADWPSIACVTDVLYILAVIDNLTYAELDEHLESLARRWGVQYMLR